MTELYSYTLCQICEMLRAKKVSVREVSEACYSRIDEVEPKIEALLAQNRDEALRVADELDKMGPDTTKPLWGVPLTVKDAISTKGLLTTAASRILENFVPFYDAYVVEQLKNAGSVILAKNNMDEFAMGSATENSAFKKTRNPWNLNCVPGGSSGGSAASVSACECFGSLGSDTGGSIRQPAAFCGCVGLKPSYGRVSRYGLFAFASSLDQIGPIARTVKDCAAIFDVIGGHDFRDNTSNTIPMPNCLAKVNEPVSDKPFSGIKIGYPEEFFGAGLDSEVMAKCLAAIKIACDLGAELVNIKLPDPQVATATYYVISMAEASSNLARYDGIRYGRRAAGVSDLQELYLKSRSQGFGQEVKRRIMLGSYVLSAGYYDAYYRKAAQTRRIIYNQYLQTFKECDFLCLPVAPEPAWELGRHEDDPLKLYLMDAFTLPVNLAGLPGLSLPVGLDKNKHLPIGMQLVAAPYAEADLLRWGHILEQNLEPVGEPSFKFISMDVNKH